jgi:PTS system nitrogen regulatory IIA component
MSVTGLSAYCDERLFVPELKAKDRDGVLVELVDQLVAGGKLRARDVILNTIRERERIWPTAIGKGVAVPHGRSLVVPDLTIVFGRSAKGIDFGAEDGAPVHLIFLIIAPYQDRENRYLPALGKVVELVSQEKNRERLLEIKEYSEFVSLLEEQG